MDSLVPLKPRTEPPGSPQSGSPRHLWWSPHATISRATETQSKANWVSGLLVKARVPALLQASASEHRANSGPRWLDSETGSAIVR